MAEDSRGARQEELEEPETAPTVPRPDKTPSSSAKPSGARPPRGRIGTYELVRELGRGGMGTVYLAARADEQFQKQVALKVITNDSAGGQIVERFKRERQILAALEHPNIARLLDGGATDDGRPYIVMEYVEGLPLDQHCSRNGLSTSERLRLFRTVCGAVQYAHRNLVVHRDLKPSNVSVTAEGVPKLLDFGIAKLLNPEAWGDAAHTATGLGPLTPYFASPEQIRGEPITTATDIYALGVMLYVLLTGRLPYRLTSRSTLEVLRAVTDEEPEPPSAAVTGGASGGDQREWTAAATSAMGEGSVKKLKARLRGDLDTILLTALRKEPERRYPSVEAFSEDLRRHLEGLPVTARKATLGYRVAKLIQRRKGAVAASTVFVTLILGASIALGVQAVRLAAARDRAEQALATAQKEAERARAVKDFLQDTLGAADPIDGEGREVTLLEALQSVGDQIDTSFSDQPDLQAEVRSTLGQTYDSLGQTERAETLLAEALALRESTPDASSLEIATDLANLAAVVSNLGKFDVAEEHYRRAIALARANEPSAPADRGDYVAVLGTLLNDLAILKRYQGDFDEAERRYREALATQRTLPEPDEQHVVTTLSNLGLLLAYKGDFGGSEPILREALETQRRLRGDRHPLVGRILRSLGAVREARGGHEEARALYEEALGVAVEAFGEEHPDVSSVLQRLSSASSLDGEFEAAEDAAQRALDLEVEISGEGSLRHLVAQQSLALVLQRAGRLDQAEATYRRILPPLTEAFGPDHHLVGRTRFGLAEVLHERGSFEEAVEVSRQALASLREAVPPTHPQIAAAESLLGACLTATREYAKAEPLLLSGHRRLQTAFGDEDRRTVTARERLVELYERWGRPEEAAEYETALPMPRSG